MDAETLAIYQEEETVNLMAGDSLKPEQTRKILRKIQSATSLEECRRIAAEAAGEGWAGSTKILTAATIISTITTLESYIPRMAAYGETEGKQLTDEDLTKYIINQMLGSPMELMEEINSVLAELRKWRPEMLEVHGMPNLKPNLLEGLKEELVDKAELLYILERLIHKTLVEERSKLKPLELIEDEDTADRTEEIEEPTL